MCCSSLSTTDGCDQINSSIYKYTRQGQSEPNRIWRRLILMKKCDEKSVQTSAGFLVRKTALILAKCVAITISVFMSSADLSSTVSQKGTMSCSVLLKHVSTMDHISLHRISVATYGYLRTHSKPRSASPYSSQFKSETIDTHLYLPCSSDSICPVTCPINLFNTSTL